MHQISARGAPAIEERAACAQVGGGARGEGDRLERRALHREDLVLPREVLVRQADLLVHRAHRLLLLAARLRRLRPLQERGVRGATPAPLLARHLLHVLSTPSVQLC